MCSAFVNSYFNFNECIQLLLLSMNLQSKSSPQFEHLPLKCEYIPKWRKLSAGYAIQKLLKKSNFKYRGMKYETAPHNQTQILYTENFTHNKNTKSKFNVCVQMLYVVGITSVETNETAQIDMNVFNKSIYLSSSLYDIPT